MKALITGATGFIGRHLVDRLVREHDEVRVLTRSPAPSTNNSIEAFAVGDLRQLPDCGAALRGCEVVVHLAARVHTMRDIESDPLAVYRAINVAVTRTLAEQAAVAGVRRFVYVSSIKVNGEETFDGQRFTADDAPAPLDAYGVSKLEAEQSLREIAGRHGMEFTVVRPPMVYGPGARANFAALMRWVARGIPLPFGAVTNNRRSLVSVGNLVDFLGLCMRHPTAANRVFLVSDDHDLSTAELLRQLGTAVGRSARLLPGPTSVLNAGARLLGRHDLARRLLGSLQVDVGHARNSLGWQPPFTVQQGLHAAAARLPAGA